MAKNKLKSKQSQKQSQKNNQNVKVVINNDTTKRRRRATTQSKANPVGISGEQSMRIMKTYTPQINNVQPDFNSLISSLRGAVIPPNTNNELSQIRNDILNIRNELRQPAPVPTPQPPTAPLTVTEKKAKPKDIVDLSAIPDPKVPIIPVNSDILRVKSTKVLKEASKSVPVTPLKSSSLPPLKSSSLPPVLAPSSNNLVNQFKNLQVAPPKAASPPKAQAPAPAAARAASPPKAPAPAAAAGAAAPAAGAAAPAAVPAAARAAILSDAEEYGKIPKLKSGEPDKRTKEYRSWLMKHSGSK